MIEKDKIKGIVIEINKKLEAKEDLTWLWFKKEIIAEYLINDNIWRYKEIQLETLWNFIKRDIKFDGDRE